MTKDIEPALISTRDRKLAYKKAIEKIEHVRTFSTMYLDLSNLNLTSLPDGIGKLTSLRTLILSNNQLTTLPTTLGRLINLKRLDLSGNCLESVPETFGALTSLMALDLKYNQLSTLPNSFAYLGNLQSLNLSRNDLSVLPETFGLLASLHTLELESNHLSTLPNSFGDLDTLVNLNLSDNQLSTLPESFGRLEVIEKLDLSENYLTALPDTFGSLNSLRTLNAKNNRLAHLPESFGSLGNLESLILKANQLKSLPKSFGSLYSIQRLYLSKNRLTTLPAALGSLTNLHTLDLEHNPLASLPKGLGSLTHLQRLYLGSTSLTDPPPEIVRQGTDAVLSYLRERKTHPEVRRWVSKLLLVGEGGVGKTQLLRSLKDEPFEMQSETTHGISVRPLQLDHPERQDVRMTLNCWDFGGQEIYHATHQFFLSNRSLYLLVWNARIGFEQSKLYYWLDRIEAIAPEAPIMLVATHVDERDADLPLADLKRRYKQIIGQWSASNKDEQRDSRGHTIPTLSKAIANAAAGLPLMGERWPKTWVNAADAIEAARTQCHMTASDMWRLMDANGIREDRQLVLARWLHELGTILYFDSDEELKDTVLLDAQWVSKNISNVLEHDAIIDGLGLFTKNHMNQAWLDIDATMCERLLRLMEKFDLSYRIPDDQDNRSLVVERLSQDSPESDKFKNWNELRPGKNGSKEISMRFDLQTSRPAGIPSWFIARSHRFTLGTHWRYGALFGDNRVNPKNLALVEAPPSERYVKLTVRGPSPHNFFTLLRDGLEVTLDRFPGLKDKIQRLIPCSGNVDSNPCPQTFVYEQVLRRYEKGKLTIQCPECDEDIKVLELLFGLQWSSTQQVIQEHIERLEGHIVQAMEEQHDETREQLTHQFRDLSVLIQRGFLTQFNAIQRLEESHCPRVFALRPKGRSAWLNSLMKEPWQLQLYCEAPGDWHPVGEPYVISRPAKWLNTLAPYVGVMVKVLKYAAPLAHPSLAYTTPYITKVIENDVKLMAALAKSLPNIEPQRDLLDHTSLTSEEDIEAQKVYDSDLRELRHLLDAIDPSNHWGGLKKTLTPEGHWLWLCPEHAHEYAS